ncbi:hypothetical protein BD289DRAFT_364337 [Coniella lustricola]|uniref:DUF974 domain-containing protein n=1 Tax=Coniella lustricola TaxID=2025994 RepID=A0A2T3ADR6_9PEZI|nr:hypothetical protein BD289DRAFT_364337 [Coniella lustricola]
MSHQRYPSLDTVKEPHSISLKVLRLSRPSLVSQYPVPATASPSTLSAAARPPQPPLPASLAYSTGNRTSEIAASTAITNPAPFLLSPILNLPPSFGSAYVGETFSCTLCANHEDLFASSDAPKQVRDVRIEAEMKTPSSSSSTKLVLGPQPSNTNPTTTTTTTEDAADGENKSTASDLSPGQTLQRIVDFDLKEEGNHVLAVTVSYYEATETSGRTRSFRKLYQFICKPSLIVRTKAGLLPAIASQHQFQTPPPEDLEKQTISAASKRRWVLEAQLENCSEDTMQLERVVLDLEPGFAYHDCNWEASGSPKPVLHPAEVEQVCFIIEEQGSNGDGAIRPDDSGRIAFGTLGIGWRGEMGSKGWLATGKLGTRYI